MQQIWFSSFLSRGRYKITVKLMGNFYKYRFPLNYFLFNAHTFILNVAELH